ncbi:MAG: hypothetical protein NXI15_04195 [Gammaproteobacteria bacterium]|nr:hypothetical protein [Gammaproteobacteria bacterium]
MNAGEIFSKCKITFTERQYPGDENIVHCTYDKKYGGEFDGPCRECTEVVEVFTGKPKFGNKHNWMLGSEFGLASITPQAFFYYLPSAIEMVLHGLDRTGSVAETLEFRFRGLDSEEWQNSHIGGLTDSELDCVKAYFDYQFQNGEFLHVEDDYETILKTIAKYRGGAS